MHPPPWRLVKPLTFMAAFLGMNVNKLTLNKPRSKLILLELKRGSGYLMKLGNKPLKKSVTPFGPNISLDPLCVFARHFMDTQMLDRSGSDTAMNGSRRLAMNRLDQVGPRATITHASDFTSLFTSTTCP